MRKLIYNDGHEPLLRRGNLLITVKLGGDIIKKPDPSLFADLKHASAQHSLILVHGGGDEVTEIADKLGKMQKFIVSPGGIRSRYTDEETVKIYTMVMCGLKSDIIVFLPDVSAVYRESKLIRDMKIGEVESTMKKVGFGLEKKLMACVEAVRKGVGKAIVASGKVEEPIARALAEKNCTVITR